MHRDGNKNGIERHQRIVVLGLIAMLLLTAVMIPVSEGSSVFALFHSDRDDTFMDFFNSVYDGAVEDPYTERGVIYPALPYLVYRNFFPFVFSGDYNTKTWRNDAHGLLTILTITVLTVLLLIRVFSRPKGETVEDRYARDFFPGLLVLGTVPFWYAYERGNLILQTVLLLMFYCRFYDSPNRILKELALLSLAFAASMKIYPAVFGLLLLRNKQFQDAIRCVLYGAIVFIVPFFFYDGIQSILQMIQNIQDTGKTFHSAEFGFGYKVNLSNTMGFLSEKTGVQIPYGICVGLLMAAFAVILCLSKEKWKIMTALAGIVVLLPQFSYTYALTLMAVPLWCFYYYGDGNRKFNWYISILFLMIMVPIPLGGINPLGLNPDTFYQLNMTTIISSLSLLLLIDSLAIDEAVCWIKEQNIKGRFNCLKGRVQ